MGCPDLPSRASAPNVILRSGHAGRSGGAVASLSDTHCWAEHLGAVRGPCERRAVGCVRALLEEMQARASSRPVQRRIGGVHFGRAVGARAGAAEGDAGGIEPDDHHVSAAISACEGRAAGNARCAAGGDARVRRRAERDQLHRPRSRACGKGGRVGARAGAAGGDAQRARRRRTIAYSAAISACGKGGQWERALELLDEMRTRGRQPDVISLQRGHLGVREGTGSGSVALSLLERDARCARGVEPDVISFNAAISACEKGGQWERALALLDEMHDARSAAGRDQLQRGHLGVREGRAVGARAGAARRDAGARASRRT